jgi:hypothetical protein
MRVGSREPFRLLKDCAGIWITEENGELRMTMSKSLEGKVSVAPGIAVSIAAPADSQP